MIKVYRCVSEISFNLKIDGSKRRINFEPMSGGKSQYRTNETAVQEGIEKLDQFGNLIHVSEVIEEDGDCDGEGGDEFSDGLGGSILGDEIQGDGKVKNQGGEGGDLDKDIQENIVSFAEAKEYLITKGCDKTIRSRDNILVYAKELGVEFPNLK